jgi:hypothetical protein
MSNINYTEIQEVFGNYEIPSDLKLLYEFENKYGSENYSECFYLKTTTKYGGLENWCESETFINKFLEFATANGSGSSYAYYLIEEKLENCPIVVFGDEGGIHVVANSTQDLIHLLTFDIEISVDHDSASFYKSEKYYTESDCKEEFDHWVKSNFNLNAIKTDTETETIINAAQEKHKAILDNFMEECGI